MPKAWRFPPYDAAVVNGLSAQLKIPTLLAQVLVARGLGTAQSATEFLSAKLVDLHEPELLPGLTDAVDRIVSAIQSGRRVTIYGDYDVDGVTSTSILWHCLKLLGAKVDYYIPHRLEEGYGVNSDSLRSLAEEDSSRLLITVDCGITSTKEADLALELGLELIISDHHQFKEPLPRAAAIVHPRLPGSQYPFGDLCGAGVAFKIAWGLCKRFGVAGKATPRMKEFLVSAVGLAAIGTVADVVPLVGENRIIVRFGLASLLEKSSSGLKALMKVSGIEANGVFQSEDIGFALAPRLNAAGRLGQARLAVELLTTEDTARAIWLADYFNQLNKDRQTVERRIVKQAKAQVEENPDWEHAAALVLADSEWHPGVIGIAASRIAEHFQKPTIIISLRIDDIGQGSCRSFAGFDLLSGLEACHEHLVTFGGHKAAAGLKVRKAGIDSFRAAFCEFVGGHHVVLNRDLEIAVDAEVRLADLTLPAVMGIERLGPFGSDNRRPVFSATKVEVAGKPDRMGEGGRHLSLRVKHYGKLMRAVAFGQGDWADEIAAIQGPISICFAPVINRFRGQENVELQLIDWRVEESV